MSTFADKKFDSSYYLKHRPSYPPQFLRHVLKYNQTYHHNDEKSFRIIDIGTGPGTTIITLIKLLPPVKTHIILTDISTPMLDQAKKSLGSLPAHITVEFIKCSAEELTQYINEPVDLITAAECIHWTNYPVLLDNCSSLLKPKGTLAYWVYVDPVFIESPNAKKLNELYEDFVYESPDKLGSYWESEGRTMLRKMVKPFNDELLGELGKNWENTVVCYLDNNKFESHGDKEWCQNLLKIEITGQASDFGEYVDTWSASHKWNACHNEKAGDLFIKHLSENFGLKASDTLKWQMKSSFVLTTKK